MRSEVESSSPEVDPRERALAAIAALRARHLRRVLGIPGTRIGVSSWPRAGRPVSRSRVTASWNYWWQAHLLDTLVDAARLGDPAAARETAQLARGIRLRNLGRWTNQYYDDMAWLALALERADRHLGTRDPGTRNPGARHPGSRRHRRAVTTLRTVLFDAWAPESGGGIPWRTSDTFFNVPANGPAGIFLARAGRIERALGTEEWIYREFTLPTGLIADGFWVEADGSRRYINTAYTYCQGVTLGLSVEAFRYSGGVGHLRRIDALLTAVTDRLTIDGVLIGHGGGDGGLFSGILARNLALVATDLPTGTPLTDELRARAGTLVLASADAAWANRVEVDGLPLFGAEWSEPAVVPTGDGGTATFVGGAMHSSDTPERDLSTQVGGAMLMTAAATVTAGLLERNDCSRTPNW